MWPGSNIKLQGGARNVIQGAARNVIQGAARNVIPLIAHVTHFYFTKTFNIWYRINPHRLENCS